MAGALRRRALADPDDPTIEPQLALTWWHRAHDAQREPDEDWRTWVFLGGRGAGKTRAGAEWLRAQALDGPVRLALVGPTLHDVREVMVAGVSGLLALGPPEERPRWEASRRRLIWENGATAQAFSAEDPDSLRGPQFHAAWADEFCAWREPERVLEMLRLTLRLGARPRLMVSTTPRPLPALRRLLAASGTVRSDAATSMNAGNLAPGFVEALLEQYGGTRLAAQELDGRLLEDADGALWTAAGLDACRGRAPDAFERVLVGVDPPATAGGDACGIVAAGLAAGTGWVLEDVSARGLSPLGWAERVCAAARRWGAGAIVAEANQGGEMVRAVLAQADPPCPVRLVHATRGKRVRAEPVAALYEQGRVRHAGTFPALEEEMMALGAEGARASPNRADALVWALGELMLSRREGPRVRVL